jgi:hypothetical protein
MKPEPFLDIWVVAELFPFADFANYKISPVLVSSNHWFPFELTRYLWLGLSRSDFTHAFLQIRARRFDAVVVVPTT